LAAVILLAASSAMSAGQTLDAVVSWVVLVPQPVLALAGALMLVVLLSVFRLRRAWVIRRALVTALVRRGTPIHIIARRARMSQDSILMLALTSGGKLRRDNEECFSAGEGRLAKTAS
jgi:hypothetical protein